MIIDFIDYNSALKLNILFLAFSTTEESQVQFPYILVDPSNHLLTFTQLFLQKSSQKPV
jgi:hypothetical protein